MSEKAFFIKLYHGRTDPHADMHEMGFAGPYIGPIASVSCTYASSLLITLTPDSLSTALALQEYGGLPDPGADYTLEILYVEELLEFAGEFYGDWHMNMYDKDFVLSKNAEYREQRRDRLARIFRTAVDAADD